MTRALAAVSPTPPSPPPAVRFTADAVGNALRLAADPRHAGRCLRVWIADKNCDGFLYGVGFDDELPGDERIPLGDALAAVVDAQAAPYLRGSLVDWADTDEGSGFVVVNPRHSEFRGKFFLARDPG